MKHLAALACGGADAPENMQWQTAAEAKLKDRRAGRPIFQTRRCWL
jgi:hypothetical protein